MTGSPKGITANSQPILAGGRRFRRVCAAQPINFEVDRSVNVGQVVPDADPVAQVLFMEDDVAVACQRPNRFAG